MFTLYTFGDSILDSGRYNRLHLTAGQLLVRNDDARFPEFAGCDLASRGPAELIHRAVDGATVRSLRLQVQDLPVREPSAALLTMGGNDLLSGLIAGTGAGIDAFGRELEAFLLHLPIRPVLIGNVYDPTFGDDAKNFLPVTPAIGRANHRRLNDLLATIAGRYGELVDLHAHFLRGQADWLTNIFEPSLIGTSEVRRAFLGPVLRVAAGTPTAN